MKFVVLAIVVVGLISSCALQRKPDLVEEAKIEAAISRMLDGVFVRTIKNYYVEARDIFKEKNPDIFPAGLAVYLQADFCLVKPTLPRRADARWIYKPNCEEYVAFIRAQVKKWEQTRSDWETIDYQIIAKGNEILERMAATMRDEEVLRNLEELNKPAPSFTIGRPARTMPRLNVLCIDAIQQRNQAAIWVHCE